MSSNPYSILTIRGNMSYDLAIKDSSYLYAQLLIDRLQNNQTPEITDLINDILRRRFVVYPPAVGHDSTPDKHERGILRILGPRRDLRNKKIVEVLRKMKESLKEIVENPHPRWDHRLGLLVSSGSLTCEYIRPSLLAENAQL